MQFAIIPKSRKNTDSSANFLSHNFHIAIFALRVFGIHRQYNFIKVFVE